MMAFVMNACCCCTGGLLGIARRLLKTQALTSSPRRALHVSRLLTGAPATDRLLPPAYFPPAFAFPCVLHSFPASSSLSWSPRLPSSFVHLLKDDLALCSSSPGATDWGSRDIAAVGRSVGEEGLRRRGGSYIDNIGRNALVGVRSDSLRLLKNRWLGGSVSPFLVQGSLEQEERNSGKMVMAVASCSGILSSMCLSTGPRSTRNVIHNSSFTEAQLVRSSRVRRSSSVAVNRCSREKISVVGLSGPGVQDGNVFQHITGVVLRSQVESKDCPGVVRASSSASSVPGISYTEPLLDEGDGGNGFSGGRGGGGGGGGGGGDHGHGGSESSGAGQGGSSIGGGGIFSALLSGWRSRVQADPQFPFKVLTEEVIGVGACVLGDMASRPNFGLDELDLVFSTIVVGSILNFTLMYMLAPTSAIGPLVTKLPGIFAKCPTGHMFEVGPYSLLDRFGTFVYKGGQFAVVGFIAGLVGTFLSTSLLNARKKMDPDFVTQNEAPPTILNAATWALHMGLSSNARYQSINGLEFAMAKTLPAGVFKTLVFLIRGLNNVLGGTSFVILARVTGSQPREATPTPMQITEDRSLEATPAPKQITEDSSLEHAKTS